MSKNIKANIIKKIKSDEGIMRPAWVFYFGSALSMIGLFVSSAIALLSIHLLRFRLTHPGVGAARKLEFVISTLPWYIPVLAVVGLIGGYLLLKRYDFSYRKNLGLITIVIVLGLIASSYLLDYLGFNSFLNKRGYFRQIYMQEQRGRLN
jgi:hypothetical protein